MQNGWHRGHKDLRSSHQAETQYLELVHQTLTHAKDDDVTPDKLELGSKRPSVNEDHLIILSDGPQDRLGGYLVVTMNLF